MVVSCCSSFQTPSGGRLDELAQRADIPDEPPVERAVISDEPPVERAVISDELDKSGSYTG
jgi:hypothetical protein